MWMWIVQPYLFPGYRPLLGVWCLPLVNLFWFIRKTYIQYVCNTITCGWPFPATISVHIQLCGLIQGSYRCLNVGGHLAIAACRLYLLHGCRYDVVLHAGWAYSTYTSTICLIAHRFFRIFLAVYHFLVTQHLLAEEQMFVLLLFAMWEWLDF